MSTPSTYRLSELTAFLGRVFALNLPQPVWVAAEIAQASPSRGHCWLTFVENAGEGDGETVAALSGVVWSATLNRLRQRYGRKLTDGLFRAGTAVRVRASASFHPRFGLRLVVEDIDPNYTIGELERRRQQVLETLAAEGLLARNAAHPLPDPLLRLAVISSETAAGLADFRAQLEENTYGYRPAVTLFTAAVQGAQTGTGVSARLRQIARRRGEFDAVALLRGGGSRTDLADFDDEGLCRAIAACPLPVLTGIGHETDRALADEVAHTSLKTPTAVAAFVIDRITRHEAALLQRGRRIGELAARGLDGQRDRLARLQRDVRLHAATTLREQAGRLAAHERLLTALRPETTLRRGYALVSQGGKLIKGVGELAPGRVRIHFGDGEADLTL